MIPGLNPGVGLAPPGKLWCLHSTWPVLTDVYVTLPPQAPSLAAIGRHASAQPLGETRVIVYYVTLRTLAPYWSSNGRRASASAGRPTRTPNLPPGNGQAAVAWRYVWVYAHRLHGCYVPCTLTRCSFVTYTRMPCTTWPLVLVSTLDSTRRDISYLQFGWEKIFRRVIPALFWCVSDHTHLN